MISLQALITIGVKSRTTASFSIRAESTAVETMIRTRNWNWFREAMTILMDTHVKKPQSSSPTTIIIMPRRSPRMPKSIDWNAWTGVTTPRNIIEIPPIKATIGLLTLNHLKWRIEMPR